MVMQEFLLAGVTVRPVLNEIESEHGCERLPAKFMDVLVALAERPERSQAVSPFTLRLQPFPEEPGSLHSRPSVPVGCLSCAFRRSFPALQLSA